MPPEIDRAHVVALARAFRLSWGRAPLAGRVGEKLGSAAGSSTEFHDYRAYVPGDDIRYIDWKAFARSEQLTVRLFREEIAPRVDLIVDETASMALTAEKALRLHELAALFALLGQAARAAVMVTGGGPPRRVHDPFAAVKLSGARNDPWPTLAGALRRRSVRIVLSDFLFPHDPAELLRTLARDAGRLMLIQLNTPEEIDPDFRGPFRLIEIEDGRAIDLDVGAGAIARYRTRFRRLRESLKREARRTHALWCELSTALSLEAMAAALVRAGILEGP
jgi:uncharacterized protein (DUF58 family)